MNSSISFLHNIRTDFRSVIFDLDGTLLNTLDDISDSMNTVLKEIGCPVHSSDNYKYFVGRGIKHLVERALPPDRRDARTLERATERMRAVYHQNWDKKTFPYPGIPGLLDELTRRYVRMSILSNKPHTYTPGVVERFLPRWTFAAVAGSKPGVPQKPNPDGALEIVFAQGENPSDVVFVGDTDVDMETACAAGLFPAGVLWGFRTGEELLESGALAVFDKPADLLQLFQN
ncbi:MAG: HAD family hydrolase [Candidatus Aminicenantes bacterium]|nr:HAD family hydrolase [Candidatus Aminicenantes bacterium]